jgi:pimeloyl-ACP methyl ester carboxylesterase
LYKRLTDDGFAPWLCETSVVGGADWLREIKAALEAADVFVFCISHHSTSRPGFFLREMEDALEMRRNRGEDSLLILPLRLEPCAIPDPLKPFMAIDLFAVDGYERLVAVLRGRAAKTARVVFSLHGIKTRGKWQKDVVPLLNAAGFTVVPPDFGNFRAVQLLMAGSRAKKIDWFREEYTRQCDRIHCERPSIIAHSFGSYLVAEALDKYREMKFDRVILCGAIVRRGYPWDEIAARGQVRAVLNQYGGNDIWARVVEWGVPDAGQSGLRGFDKPAKCLVQQRQEKFAHSDYFYDLNYRENWIPFLQGKAVGAGDREAAEGWNWRFAVVRAVLFLVLAAAVVVSYRWWRREAHSVGQSVKQATVPAAAPAATVQQESSGNQSPNLNGTEGSVTIQYGDRPAKGSKAKKP